MKRDGVGLLVLSLTLGSQGLGGFDDLSFIELILGIMPCVCPRRGESSVLETRQFGYEMNRLNMHSLNVFPAVIYIRTHARVHHSDNV